MSRSNARLMLLTKRRYRNLCGRGSVVAPKSWRDSFRTVRSNTIKIAGEIPEEKYGFRPAEGCRSIAETLVHIAVMSRVPEQIHAVEHRSTLERRRGRSVPFPGPPGWLGIRKGINSSSMRRAEL